jgi:exopolysaccharide production protein ExoY
MTESVGEAFDPSRAQQQRASSRQIDVVKRRRAAAQYAKRSVDILGALTFFTLFLPLFLTVAIGVRLSSPGPIYYSQARVGQNGRKFRVYKFRSMVLNSEEALTSFLDSNPEAREQWNTYYKLDNDPRITRFGNFIRRSSLDELPQFWNVLIGDMSLVGPRPVTANEAIRYGDVWNLYCAVRPGLTGLWQVSGRNRLTYPERVYLDGKYVENWSLWADFKIFLATFKAVLWRDGSR